jgi:excisionase family DNA binding protein
MRLEGYDGASSEGAGKEGAMGRKDGEALPHLLDIEAVAEHLGVSVRHVRRLVSERRIPYLKWGHLLRFDPAAIAEWLDQNRLIVQGFTASPQRDNGQPR